MSAVVDFADLSVNIKLNGLEQTTAQLAQLETLGEQAGRKVEAAFAPAQQAVTGAARAGDTAASSYRSLGDSTRNLVGHTEAHAFAMGRAIRATEGLAVESLGLNHQLSTLGVLLAEFGAGGGPVLVAVAAIAALGLAFEKITGSSRETREEQEKLTKAAEQWYELQRRGLTNQRLQQIDAEQKKLKDLTEQYEALTSAAAAGRSALGAGDTLQSVSGIGGVNDIFLQATGGTPLAATYQTAITSSATEDVKRQIKELKELIDALREDERKAVDETIASTQLELDRRIALNAAYKDGALTLATISSHYDTLAAIQKISADATEDQRAKLVALFHEIETQKGIEALNKALAETKNLLDQLEHALDGVKTTLDLSSGGASTTPTAGGAAAKGLAGLLAALQFNIPVGNIGGQIDASVAKQKEYEQQVQQLWTRGIEEIATHGLQSFTSFFDQVLNLFRRLMVQMQQAGKTSGTGYQLLGLASAGISGGLAGYQLGQSTGYLGGILGGAGSGALAGGQIPGGAGAIIGGLAGAAGGLLGAADAQSKAAEQLQAAADALRSKSDAFIAAGTGGSIAAQIAQINQTVLELARANLDLYQHGGISDQEGRDRDAAQGLSAVAQIAKITFGVVSDLGQQLNALNGPAGAFANALDDINKKYEQNVQNIRDLGLGEDAVNEAEAIRIGQIRQLILAEANLANITGGLLSRFSSITGATIGGGDPFASLRQAIADALAQGMTDLAASLQQELGLDEQFNAYLDGLERAKTDAAAQQAIDQASNALLQSQLDVAKQSLQTQEQSVNALQGVVDNLRHFQDSFKLDLSLTTLSPRGQLDEAARQFRALLAQANAGDVAAGNALGASAQQYATIGKSYFGSTSGYVDIFNEIQSGVGGAQGKFGTQLDTQQSILVELQKQTGIMDAQLATTTRTSDIANLTAKVNAERSLSGGANPLDERLLSLLLFSGAGSLADVQKGLGSQYAAIANNFATGNVHLGNNPAAWAANAAAGWYYDPVLGWSNPDPNAPQYARGGDHRGGWRVVGERGPELELTGPSRIQTAEQLSAPTVAAVARLEAKFDRLIAATNANALAQRTATAKAKS